MGCLFVIWRRPSISRRANCFDNAVTETLFGSLKVERLHGETIQVCERRKMPVINWIVWNNQKRMHLTLGYQNQVEFEKAWQRQQLDSAA
jgi:putative transposase